MANNYTAIHHLTTSPSTHVCGSTTGTTTHESQGVPESNKQPDTTSFSQNDTFTPAPRQNQNDYPLDRSSHDSQAGLQNNTQPATTSLPQNDTMKPAPRQSENEFPLDRSHEHGHEPRTSVSQEERGSLAGTKGPFHVPTTDDVNKSNVPPHSSVGQQNAPGAAGSIGEKAMGALGYGGSTVERPKEEQGLGEKIMNFLGT
ncbi:hypothetical protein PMZ80_004585 [Knufia obscura]|uniref:Uncharacterized protein n=1 Tax=Knufia obscura TaxID=1635080 RepID=A0ABR0RSI2_9EURO|nr:hypothetical protein PMZ80_004585 [Knufia obscura]